MKENDVVWHFRILEDDSGRIVDIERSVSWSRESRIPIKQWRMFREKDTRIQANLKAWLDENNLSTRIAEATLGDEVFDTYLTNAIRQRIKGWSAGYAKDSFQLVEDSFDDLVFDISLSLTNDYDPISEKRAIRRYLIADPRYEKMIRELLIKRVADSPANEAKSASVQPAAEKEVPITARQESEVCPNGREQGVKVSWDFYALEDDSGHMVAFDVHTPGLETQRWVEDHCNVKIEGEIWRLQFRQDDDDALRRAEKNCANRNDALNTRSKLRRFMRVKKLHMRHIEATFGDALFDDYLADLIEGYTKHIPKDRLDRTIQTVEESFADYVDQFVERQRFRFLTRLITRGKPDATQVAIRNYYLANSRYEELVNKTLDEQLLDSVAKHTSTEGVAAIRTSGEPYTPSDNSSQISSWDRHGLLLAPNGRCPMCNYPLSTRKSGLSAGKAAAGGILAGPAGAIIGASMGKKEYYCPSCGYKR